MGRQKRKAPANTHDEIELQTRQAQRVHPNQLAGRGQIVIPQKKLYRQRPHVNPFSDHNVVYPSSPAHMDWHFHFPDRIPASGKSSSLVDVPKVEFADVGCGFGGLIFYLAPHFPDKLIVGIEIRTSVTQYVYDKVQALRLATIEGRESRLVSPPAVKDTTRATGITAGEEATEAEINTQLVDEAPDVIGGYQNISALRVNAMKHLPNFFERAQLSKLFFLHPDPHFKQRKSKNRIISPTLLAEYAYVLRPGGILYTITDVEDLHTWMVKHLSAFPLFERIPDDDEHLKHDVCVDAVWNATEEGKKVIRNRGSKWFAAFRRIRDSEGEEQIE